MDEKNSPMLAYLESIRNAPTAVLESQLARLEADSLKPIDVYLRTLYPELIDDLPRAALNTHKFCLTCGHRLAKRQKPDFLPAGWKVVK